MTNLIAFDFVKIERVERGNKGDDYENDEKECGITFICKERKQNDE